MGILEFVHAQDPAENRELFGLLGEYATSPLVREKLGGVINSEPGTSVVHPDDGRRDEGNGLWFVAFWANGGPFAAPACAGGGSGYSRSGTVHRVRSEGRGDPAGDYGLLDPAGSLSALRILFHPQDRTLHAF